MTPAELDRLEKWARDGFDLTPPEALRLVAALREAREVLEELEHGAEGIGNDCRCDGTGTHCHAICSICGSNQPEHLATCSLARALGREG